MRPTDARSRQLSIGSTPQPRLPAEVRLYDHLFVPPRPDAAGFASQLNPNSLRSISGCMLEPAVASDQGDGAVQFERQGYFYRDKDSLPGRLVFNRTVGLRDTWATVRL